jgi:hypothetical protein
MLNPVLKSAIRCYQWLLSPLLAPTCRFHPTCSHYAIQALDRYAFFPATRRILARLSKCHPFHDGGYDPLP